MTGAVLLAMRRPLVHNWLLVQLKRWLAELSWTYGSRLALRAEQKACLGARAGGSAQIRGRGGVATLPLVPQNETVCFTTRT